MAYKLESAVQRAKNHPQAFKIPDEKDRRSIRPGDFVKLIFAVPEYEVPERYKAQGDFKNLAERMWVRVTSGTWRTGFEGTLENVPKILKGTRIGDPVSFNADHICDIDRVLN